MERPEQKTLQAHHVGESSTWTFFGRACAVRARVFLCSGGWKMRDSSYTFLSWKGLFAAKAVGHCTTATAATATASTATTATATATTSPKREGQPKEAAIFPPEGNHQIFHRI